MRSLVRITSRTLIVAAAGTLLGCGELAHTNPEDPESHFSVTVEGPTEIHSHGQIVTYTFTAVPEWHFTPPGWNSSPQSVLALAGADGRFVSGEDGEAVVEVQLEQHRAWLHVKVVQIPTSISVNTCDGTPATIPSPGGTLPLCAVVSDSIGSPVMGRTVTFTSADTTIVATQDTVAVGRGAGRTYVRASLGALTDSLLVTVGG